MPIDDNKSINNFGWEPQWQLRFPKTVLDVNSENPPELIFDFKSQNSKLDKSLDTKNSNIFNEMFEQLKNRKQEVLTTYVCEPDALRVARPIYPELIQSPPREIEVQVKVPDIPNCKTTYTKNFNVTKELFNGSAQDLNRCLKGTKLAGMGQMFLDAQDKYGINAIFLMAIARGESGYGKRPQKNPFSIFGTGDRTSKSYAQCLDKLGNNLKQNYITKNKLETLDKINKRYAPDNSKWAEGIAKHMSIISKQIMSEYQ